MSASARSVLTAAVVFAIAMGALQDGGWWWLWFGVAWLVVIGPRLPLFGRVKISAANRYIMRENRVVRAAFGGSTVPAGAAPPPW
jgi:hypothetical protein